MRLRLLAIAGLALLASSACWAQDLSPRAAVCATSAIACQVLDEIETQRGRSLEVQEVQDIVNTPDFQYRLLKKFQHFPVLCGLAPCSIT